MQLVVVAGLAAGKYLDELEFPRQVVICLSSVIVLSCGGSS